MNIRIGTAGWSLSSRRADFPDEGTHLQRYAQRLNAVEINSSFYRHHRPATYAKWAQSVPADFRFCVKTPKLLTHRGAFDAQTPALPRFAEEVSALGSKLAVLLVQLPPSFAFEAQTAQPFLETLLGVIPARIACEPRHPTWGTDDADALLKQLGVARVAADPPRWNRDSTPGGARDLSYFRLHGAPRMYYSNYDEQSLSAHAEKVAAAAEESGEVWCIFDNTAHGHAIGNALDLAER